MSAVLGFAPQGVRAGFSPPAPSPTSPLSIVTSRTPFFFLSGDLGITLGTGVSAWADQTGNGRDAIQGTAGKQPAYNASDADFGGRGSVLGDGSDDVFTMAWDPPAPGTTPVWFFAVYRMVSAPASSGYILAGGNLILGTAVSAAANVSQYNPNLGVNPVVTSSGVTYRLESSFTNSTSDYVKVGASSATGANAGNSNATSFFLLGRDFATTQVNAKIACAGAWNGQPTSGERAALDAWVTSYYGPGVAV